MSGSNRVLVVGSGPGGAAAAWALSQHAGIETLVLEAGSGESKLGFTLRVNGFTLAKRRPELRQRPGVRLAGDPTAVIFEALAPGGLSNHWSCAVPRFSEDDFQDATRAGEEYTWPVSYADLAPWYARVEPLLSIAGADHDTPRLPGGRVAVARRLGADWRGLERAAATQGRDVVPMPYAYGGSVVFVPSGTSFNAYTRVIAPAVRRGATQFRGDTRVVSLEWSAAERRVVAAIVVNAAGLESRIPCRAVVVAGGALNSPQIMLSSVSADFPNGLGNEHDVLGRYLHDHPLGKIILDLDHAVSVRRPAYITRPALARTQPLLATAFMQWMNTATLARSIVAGRPGRAKDIGFTVLASMVPRAENYVALEKGSASSGRPRLTVALTHPPEIAALLQAARCELVAMFEQAGLHPREHVWKVDPPGASVHYGGTCRMHASPRFGVVDGWSRVHGVRNVVVADSSVFTTTPEKNPVLTSMTLAARAAHRLAGEIMSGDL